jgi:hypothetical protein
MHFLLSCFIRAAWVLALFPALSSAATIGSGHSGMWYDPARSGEGLQLEILGPDVALVEWYTYDAQGRQRWIQGVGNIAGNSIQFPQVYTTQGGKFGPAFNPDDVKVDVVGNLSLTFGDCNTGTFRYTAFGQSQTLPIQRLTQTMGAGCAPINGVPGEPVMSYAGQSGSWYNTTRSGEGFDLQWLSNGAAIVTWYTYDAAGNQVWLLGVGSQQGNAIVFDQMAITNGPKFGASYDTGQLQTNDWGSLTLTLDCNGGTAHYASNQTAYGSGDLTLTRLTALQQPACPYVAPKFSDLYSVAWDEIPIDAGTTQSPNEILVDSIAGDGTIAAHRSGQLALWHANTRTWEDVSRGITYTPALISPDGSTVIATDSLSISPEPTNTLMWQRATGWQMLPGSTVDQSILGNVSKNFQFAVGYGHNNGGPDQAWIRAIDGVQRSLPLPESGIAAGASAASDDGNIVIGNAIHFTPEGGDWPQGFSIRWIGNEPPTILRDPAGNALSGAGACNADCSIIFGSGAWFLKSDGTFGYLGVLSDAYPTSGPSGPYYIGDASSDGSLVVGTYLGDSYLDHPEMKLYASRPFIWTQATGMVAVRSLVAELGIGDDDWSEIDTMRLAPDGQSILVGGMHRTTSANSLGHSRAVVLRLTPKTSTN